MLSSKKIAIGLLALLAISSANAYFLHKVNEQTKEEIHELREAEYLPADKAFVVTLKEVVAGHAKVNFEIAPGHYLYRERFRIVSPGNIWKMNLPDGWKKKDPNFGPQQVFFNEVVADIEFEGQMPEVVEIKYQGCSEQGLCYPPETVSISLTQQMTEITNIDKMAL
ncbi:MAG: protein-disulfide reductase DsbD domain-containing protein [Methylophilus sp.]|uniref:protein-disulfide reductase DsbD domain-containing protein n=1 Tax=Methylophilus sp. TaxID=29541 RepID=UPI003FA04263